MYRLLRGKSEGKSNGAGNTQQCNGLPDNSAANATITTSLTSEDNSAFTGGSTSIIEQGTAESLPGECTSLSLSLKRPHGKRVASDGDSENLSSKTPLKNTGKAVKVGVAERFSCDTDW